MAERLGVDTGTVTNWELNRTKPALQFLPGIMELIGPPSPPAGATLADQLLSCRTSRGLSQAAAARLLGVDPGTLSRWERSRRVPPGRYVRLLKAFLGRAATGSPV